jgi:glyoxylase-like metal-dependent hydrolase (beta-lactamase superfamily II)
MDSKEHSTMKLVRLMFTLGALALSTTLAFAQGQDFSKVEIKANKVADNFYTLDGQGGTIGVLFGPDGVFMVDTQFAPLSGKIAAAIKQLTPQPIKFVVNTHVHGDHTGGDENFGKMGATIIARDELRFRLAHPNPQANGTPGTPMPAAGLPSVTYRGAMMLHMNGEEVQLIAVPRAHTDGDTMVYFPGLDVIMTGDFFRSVGYPNADRANGGSVQGLIDGLGTVIGRAGPNTKIIPGHGPTVDRLAVMAHRDVAMTIRDRVAALVDQGKTEDEVVAAKVTADLDAKIQQPGNTAERFVRQAYQEAKATR